MLDVMFKVKEEKESPGYSQFVIEPLEPGFGHTIGNALRRVLLTSIQGAALTSVKINGVKHRFSTLPGLKENIVDFLLNLKEINFTLSDSKTGATARLTAKGPKELKASDIELSDGLEISNEDVYLGSLSEKGKIDMELTIEKGYGYSLSEEKKTNTLGVIPTDAIFSPVRRVNYTIEATRVGRQTNLDKLILDVWTNGTVTPNDALMNASKILSSYFLQIYEPKTTAIPSSEGALNSPKVSEDILKMMIDELDLPTRIYNSLRNGGIETLGQLLDTSRKELMSMRNMGTKSIVIIEEKLKEKGISLSI